MMNALEVRAPYLDIDLVNLVRRIPAAYKYRNRTTKYILKKALKNTIPSSILYRRKHGFGVPIGKWFREGYFEQDHLSDVPSANFSYYLKCLKEHHSGKKDYRMFLWHYWVLAKYRTNLLQVPEDWG
jgi:asparagine synthase (glutamine-hydrolysing)